MNAATAGVLFLFVPLVCLFWSPLEEVHALFFL